MFKLKADPTFECTVQLTRAGSTSVPLKVVFNHKGRKALKQWIHRPAEVQRTGVEMDEGPWIAEVLTGWSGVVDEAGNDVPFSVEALETLLEEHPAAASDLFQAYTRALMESRVKN